MVMNRLAMIAATGFLAVLLTACGDDTSKPADVKTETTVQTQPNDAGKTDTTTTTTQPSNEGQSQ